MAVYVEQLRKSYVAPDGTVSPVVHIDSLALAGGEQVALVGSSGSGKTTLLHLIAGILTPDSGRILFDLRDAGGAVPAMGANAHVLSYMGPSSANPILSLPDGVVNLTGLSEARRDVFRGRYIGYIFQTHHLLPGFTALENVLLGMSFTGRKHDTAWARHLLEEVGLSDRLDYKPQKLSLGQQQRVAVARALANRPRLVLADEPTGALDATNAKQVLDLIRQLCTEVNATLLLVSHDPHVTGQFPRVLNLAEINLASGLTQSQIVNRKLQIL